MSVKLTSLYFVPVDVDPEEPDDEPNDLTPVEPESLRRALENLRAAMPKIDLPKIAPPPGVLDDITKFNNLGIKHTAVWDSPAFKLATGDFYKSLGILNNELLKGILGTQTGLAASAAKLGILSTKPSALDALAKTSLPSMTGMSEAVRALYPDGFTAFKNLPLLDQSMASSMLPALAAGSAWRGQLASINADLLKTTRLPQTQLGFLANSLARNADFGLGKGAETYLKQFAANQSKWMAGIAPLLSSIRFRPYPKNLEAIDDLRISEVQAVVMLDGIALYGVPRASIAEALIRAESSGSRRRIVGRQWKKITEDCRSAINGHATGPNISEVQHALAAIEALEAGHTQAAQALVGSVLDTLVNGYFGKKRHDFTPNGKTKNSDAYDRMHVRQYIAFAPVWQAYQQYFPGNGDPVPHAFSRHATTHTASRRQYTRVNTVQALMIVCGILIFLAEEDATEQAA